MKNTILAIMLLCGASSFAQAQVSDLTLEQNEILQRGRGGDDRGRGDGRRRDDRGRGDGRDDRGRGDDRRGGGRHDDHGRGDGRGRGDDYGRGPGRHHNPPGRPGYPRPPQMRTDYVNCQSVNYGYNQCYINPFNIQSIRIVRQMSRAACIWNQTTGVMNGLIWVNHGCAATFEIVYY